MSEPRSVSSKRRELRRASLSPAAVDAPPAPFLDRGPAPEATAAGKSASAVVGKLFAKGRLVPRVSTRLSVRDRAGNLLARWGWRRSRHRVTPGIYAVGKPGSASAVYVTANYKPSFDALRSALDGLDAWLLVLDTKGVNVWCAAGKGSFGADELAARIESSGLADLVSARELVLPQLGAAGVSAPEVARKTGFRVVWGPVRAEDIPAWLAAGRRKDDRMRRVRFALRDRVALAPIELLHAWPLLLAAFPLASLWALPFDASWADRAASAFAAVAGALPVGTLLFAALLPWLPSRAFSVKGAVLGLAWSAAWISIFAPPPLAALAGLLVATPIVAFLGMNFTGSSTFTCQSGVALEVRRSAWPMVSSLVAGIAAAVSSRALGA